ncbi:LTA synthase family protein [Nocardioides sp. GXZ039]|uniref:LTA synthase family protein n=1 Tax=Nocardioides sp. GXZ039 TaxID=3136018 RepID=UPI0030F4A5B4
MSEQLVDEPVEATAPSDETSTTPWQALLWALRVSWLGAMACALALELSGLIGEESYWWHATFVDGLSYVMDCVVIWIIMVVLIGLTNRVVLSLGIVAVGTVTLAAANRVKLGLRSEPVYPSDVDFLREPKFLLSQVSTGMLILAGVGLAGLLVLAWYLGRRFEPPMPRIWPTGQPLRVQWTAVIVRALIVTLAIGMLQSTRGFNDPGNPWRGLYEVGDSQRWRPWNQRNNYLANGFVGGFLSNMPTVAMQTPDNYSEETMDALATRYERAAARINRDRSGSLDGANVVVVLSESFSDPTQLEGFELERDPIPNIRKIMQQGTSGTMLAQLLGGGTANMEFEALTGESIALFEPQLTTPYQMLVADYDQYPSAVGWFKSHGHDPVAVHPYLTSFYKRDKVYQTFGFDRFIHDTTMTEQERIDDNEFISDQSAFDEVSKQIADSDEPLMVNLVTMQNHIPVDGNYREPIPVTGVDGDQAERIGQYARGLSYTDEAVANFLSGLKKSKERTVVVFYGDHLPGIYDSSIADQNPDLGLYTTPFFIWDSKGTPQQQLPQTSPSQFLPLLYDTVDAPIPPYYVLLNRLRKHISAMEQGRYITPDGRQVTEEQLGPRARRLLEDARLVQYDFSIGDRYSVERMWPGSLNPETD